MSRTQSENRSTSEKTISSSELVIIENYFCSPSSSSVGEAKDEYEIAVVEGISEVGEKGFENESSTGIKRRIRSTWNTAKYDNRVSRWVLKRRSSFERDRPVWLLGKMYSWHFAHRHGRGLLSAENRSVAVAQDDAYRAFMADFSSRIWFTYRKDFTKLNGCRLRSDCGWGCMLRCGQMLMAQTLVCHILGRDWVQSQDREDPMKKKWHRQIVAWFLDCPKRPFSLHRLVELGLPYGKRGGDWYGPASTALILRDALDNRQLVSNSDHDLLDDLAIFVATDGVVYLDELEQCAGRLEQSGSESDTAKRDLVLGKSILLIVPLRLGADKCNPVYVYHLKSVLSLKSCVGILGGKPKHSMYFTGWQRESLVYLDPHYCQDAVETGKMGEFSLQTFHCKWPRKIAFADIDPSCAVGFYLRSGTDMQDFLADLIDIVEYGAGVGAPVKFPLFSVMQKRPVIQEPRRDDSAVGAVDEEISRRCSATAAIRGDYVFL